MQRGAVVRTRLCCCCGGGRRRTAPRQGCSLCSLNWLFGCRPNCFVQPKKHCLPHFTPPHTLTYDSPFLHLRFFY